MPFRQNRCVVRIRTGGERDESQPAGPWAKKFVDLAVLSALVYRTVPNNLQPPSGWSRSQDPRDTVDDSKTSLYFEVWERTQSDKVEVVAVFRGTHELKDWWSNLRWVTRFIPTGWDQYDLTRQEIPGVVDRAKRRHPKTPVEMATAGHSLGGGLAQQAAYAHPDIKVVVAFDPSPVTGFRSVPEPARDTNRQGIVISRAYERGEILSYLRQFIRRFAPLSIANPAITEFRFNVTRGDPIKEHSMVKLARGLARAAVDC